MTQGSPHTVALGAAAAGVLLLLAAPGPTAALRTVRGAAGASWAGAAGSGAAGASDPLVALLALAAWTLVAWLAATVGLTAGGHLPGQAGRTLAVVARKVAPLAVRRGVETALGLTVIVGGLASPAAALTSTAATATAGTTASTAAAMTTTGTTAATTPVTPALDWTTVDPLATEASATAPDLDWSPSRAAGEAVEHAPGDPLIVRPGDTLWGLAEQRLHARDGVAPSDAEIASAWPSWWSANREAVGDDPHLLRPGTSLSAPAALPPAR